MTPIARIIITDRETDSVTSKFAYTEAAIERNLAGADAVTKVEVVRY